MREARRSEKKWGVGEEKKCGGRGGERERERN